MSCSEWKETEVGKIPSHWNIYTVDELVKEKILDKPLDGNHGSIHPTQKDFVEYGIPFIMASDIKNNNIDYSTCKFITEEQSKTLKKGFAKEGDVLLTHKATIGRTCIVKDLNTPYIVLTPQVTYYRILDNTKLNNEFLKYYFLFDKFSELLNNWSQSGSTRAYIGITAQGKLPIIVPPLKEQEKIVDILSSLDDKIELNNEMNKTLEEMAQSIFKRWFIDFEFPNEDGQPYKSSGGEMVESELGMIPKGWEIKTIGELCEVGSSKRIFMKEYVDKGVPFFRSKEIIERSKGNSISTELFITQERFNEIKGKFGVPVKNDILLTSVGTLGVPYLVDDKEFYFKDGNLTWFKNFKEEVFRYYIYQWLLSSEGKKSIDEVTIGSTQKALTINSLKSMRLVVPNTDILDRYSKFISLNIESIRANNKQKFTLIDLRDSLLPKLMSGKL